MFLLLFGTLAVLAAFLQAANHNPPLVGEFGSFAAPPGAQPCGMVLAVPAHNRAGAFRVSVAPAFHGAAASETFSGHFFPF